VNETSIYRRWGDAGEPDHRCAAVGFAVPAGVVVPVGARSEPGLAEHLMAAARLGADRFAVRSSATAEDLPTV
jgi:hypothetical protein